MIALIKRLIDISGENKGKIYVAFIFSFLKSLLSKMPIIMAFIAIDKFHNGSISISLCVWLGIIMVICLGLQILMQISSDKLQSSTGYMVFAQKRLKMAQHLRRMPMGYFTEGNIGKISSILATDMVFVEGYCMNELANIMSYIFSGFIMITVLSVFNFWLGLTAILFLCIIFIISKYMRKSSLADSEIRQERNENLTESVLEFIEGISIIKTYNIIGEKSKDLIDNFRESCDGSLKYEENHSIWQRKLFIVYGIGTTVIIALSLIFEHLGLMNEMFVVGILLFSFDLFAPIKALYNTTPLLTIMNSCMDRIDSVFDETELSNEGTKEIPNLNKESEIKFENVSFGYGEKEVLRNISFELHKNQMTALVGPSGGGKSTIANLLARFWDVESGNILIRGVDIRQVPISNLMDHVSMVFQRVYLFNDTIYNNISIGRPDASREEVIVATKKARCYDFIMALPLGFDTMVGESGATLSGGEKQRISIARCIIKNTPIVILDEATASVDADNESYIQEAINELCKGKTLLVIAHRLGTIRNANEILFISDGIIKEQGSHNELMDNQGLYSKFVNIRKGNFSINKINLD